MAEKMAALAVYNKLLVECACAQDMNKYRNMLGSVNGGGGEPHRISIRTHARRFVIRKRCKTTST